MSLLHTKITMPFGDGEHTFDVGPLGIRLELEEKCGNSGLLAIHRRLQTDCRIMDYRETIRLGLIGGGMKPLEALKLVKRYVEDRPAQESVPIALMILMAGLVGVPAEDEKGEDPPLGKPQAERTSTGPNSKNPSAAPTSTSKEPPSASPQDKLTKSPTGNSSSVSKGTTKPTAVPKSLTRRLPQNSTGSSKATPKDKPANPSQQ